MQNRRDQNVWFACTYIQQCAYCILMQIFACYSREPFLSGFIIGTLIRQSEIIVIIRCCAGRSKSENTRKFTSLCFPLFSKVRYDTLLSIFNIVENYYRTKTTEHCRKVPISKIRTTDNSKKIWQSLTLRIIEV